MDRAVFLWVFYPRLRITERKICGILLVICYIFSIMLTLDLLEIRSNFVLSLIAFIIYRLSWMIVTFSSAIHNSICYFLKWNGDFYVPGRCLYLKECI